MKKSSECFLALGVLTAAFFALPDGRVGAEEQRSDASAPPDRAKLIVVRNSAQWCKVCTTTKTAFAELTDQISAEPVLFVTLDLTHEKSRRQAAYLAHALGIHDQIADSLGMVGTVLIVDAESKRLISKRALSPDVDDMSRTVRKALSKAS